MWSIFFSYVSYLSKAKTKYSIHSPFVFDFITQCLEKNVDDNLIQQFKYYQKQFASDDRIIEVKDFGAGSKVFKSNKRTVKDIAKVAGMQFKKARLLLKIIRYFKPENILEIGTSLGIGTSVFKIANPDAHIITMEGCPNTAEMAQFYFQKNGFSNIEIIVGEFSEKLPQITDNHIFDMIYFDGNHQEEATVSYFNTCLKTIQNNTLFIFDDIHWTKEMENAWQKICENEKVTVSIDLFYMGLVFFRKESVKQHFILY